MISILNTPKYSLVIPAYNEAGRISHLLPELDDEVFEYINLHLQDKIGDVEDEKSVRMTYWHDELYRIVNNSVLYNK